MKFLIILFMIFAISGLLIIHNNNLNIYKSEDSKKFTEIYSHWADKFFLNVQSLTGNAVRLDWFPE